MASHQLCHRIVGRGTEHNFPARFYKGCAMVPIHFGGQTDCPICVGNVNTALIRKAKTAYGDHFEHAVLVV